MANEYGTFGSGLQSSGGQNNGITSWIIAVLVGIAVSFAFYGVYRGSTDEAVQQSRPWYVPSIWLLTILVFVLFTAISIGILRLRTTSVGIGSLDTLKTNFIRIATNPILHVLLILFVAIIVAIYIIYPAAFQGKNTQEEWLGPYRFKSSNVIAADYEMPRSLSSVEYTHSCFMFIDPTNSQADVPRPITVMERASMWRIESIPSRGQLRLTVNSGVAGAQAFSTTVENVPIQRYVFLTLVVKNIDVRLFMDGQLVAGLTTGSLPALNNSPLVSGTASGARDAGSVRMVGYWSRALSTSEIRRVYSQALVELGTPAPGPYDSGSNILSSLRNLRTRVCFGDYCTG